MKNTTNQLYIEQISQWLDHQLEPEAVARLERAIAEDEQLRRTYRSMQHIDRLLQQAAGEMAAPGPGFAKRVESRLVHYRPRRAWQVWLAVAGLIIGTLLFAGSGLFLGGTALLTVGSAALDPETMYQGILLAVNSVSSLRTVATMGVLLGKAGLFIAGQPLFWLLVLLAIGAAWLWMRVLQTLSRRTVDPAEMLSL